MRIMGIDPGSRNTGIGIVESTGDGIRYVDSHCIRMGSEALPSRLGQIFAEVTTMIERTRPDGVAVEQVFMSNNAKSALILGQARGSAICSAVNSSLEVWEYSALEIKKSVVGTGSAKKEQVQHMVRVLLGLTANPGTDEADALACAICHIHTAQVQTRLASAL